MIFLLLETGGVLGFFTGLLTGAASTLIISRFIEPLYDSYIDGLKNNSGLIGRLYNWYTRGFGRFYFLRKKKRSKPLQKTGYEYKLYVINNKIEAYRSEILRLDENRFKRIQGEIKRVTAPNKAFTSYFKGLIKNKEKDYLIWEESYKNEEGHFHLTSHFKLTNQDSEDIPGISVEEKNGKIYNALTILSFSSIPYTSVQRLLKDKNYYKDYTIPLNIDFDNINGTQNQFITD